MKTVILSICLAQIVLFTENCHAQSRFFRDEFRDGDHQDSEPVNWQHGLPWGGGSDFVEEEDLFITDCLPGACVIAPQIGGAFVNYQDVSMRVRGKVLEGVASIVPWGRWTESRDESYHGFVRAESGLVAVGIAGRRPEDQRRDTSELSFNASDQDIVIKVDIIGNETSVAAWIADEDRQDMPVASFRDDASVSGVSGISFLNRGDDPASVVYRWIEFAEILPGDVDTNSIIDGADVDHLSAALRDGLDNNRYDVNRDGSVNNEDYQSWVKDIQRTWFGDANLDGEFNSGDLVNVFQAGMYESNLNAGWAQGDWTGDQRFDSSDLVAAFQDGGFEQGPFANVVQVPEPSGVLLLLGLISSCRLRNLKRFAVAT